MHRPRLPSKAIFKSQPLSCVRNTFLRYVVEKQTPGTIKWCFLERILAILDKSTKKNDCKAQLSHFGEYVLGK